MKRIAIIGLLAGCNSILGVDDLSLSDAGVDPIDAEVNVDAPPNTVIGSSNIIYSKIDGEETLPEDLRDHVIQAYVTDATMPTGYRVRDGVGLEDGTFSIADVPDGVPYLLKVVPPRSAYPSFFATTSHVIDLGIVVAGRPDVAPVTLTAPVRLQLGSMQPWAKSATESSYLAVNSFNTGTEQWYLDGTPEPTVGATALDTVFEWANGWSYNAIGFAGLLDAAHADDLHVFHFRHAVVPDGNGRLQSLERPVDHAVVSGVTMASGTETLVTGDFAAVPFDRSVNVTMARGTFDAAWVDGTTSRQGIAASVALTANPHAGTGLTIGFPLFNLYFEDWTGGVTATTFPVSYGDPFPQSWQRVVTQFYPRVRWIRYPGANRGRWLIGGFRRVFEPVAPFPSQPNLAPPTGIRVGDTDGLLGGRAPFDGQAPVVVSWDGVANATHYEVWVNRIYVESGSTRNARVAALSTRDTSIAIPAEVFSGGEFWAFQVTAVRAGNDYAQGRVRDRGFPWAEARMLTGMFRLSDTCGDGALQPGESCDPGASETVSCDLDCTPVECGDGLRNIAAGEVCDPGWQYVGPASTSGCDPDCTLPVCGDGVFNPDFEDCDDGNNVEDDNGCSGNCLRVGTCGDGVVQTWFENCDDGPGGACADNCAGAN